MICTEVTRVGTRLIYIRQSRLTTSLELDDNDCVVHKEKRIDTPELHRQLVFEYSGVVAHSRICGGELAHVMLELWNGLAPGSLLACARALDHIPERREYGFQAVT
jgi:hypothetical protein